MHARRANPAHAFADVPIPLNGAAWNVTTPTSVRAAFYPEPSDLRAPMKAENRVVTSTVSLLYVHVRVEGIVRWFLQGYNLAHHDAGSGHQTRIV